jgi:hypothetical protein
MLSTITELSGSRDNLVNDLDPLVLVFFVFAFLNVTRAAAFARGDAQGSTGETDHGGLFT